MRQPLVIGLCVLLISCSERESEVLVIPAFSEAELTTVPTGFPEIDFPEDNPFTLAKWELGKALFYDPIMSRDLSVSCASCHQPGNAFADVRKVSLGVDNLEGTRNSPSLANVAYQPYFTREGGVPTLEMQILVPIQEHNEFDYNIVALAERLQEDEFYVNLSQKAFDRDPDSYVITRALATFERTLISGNSDYDRYAFQGEQEALSRSEERGMELFFSDRTLCSSCHSGFNFTDYSFQNNGLYANYSDEGRMRLTNDPSDKALFKVPSLRNVEHTAPYMHDGSISTLREVVEHYNRGGEDCDQKSPEIQPLQLTEEEISDLVHFLESLSDQKFMMNTALRNE